MPNVTNHLLHLKGIRLYRIKLFIYKINFSLIALTVSVYRAATNNNPDNALYILNSGKILTLVESLVRHLTVSDSELNQLIFLILFFLEFKN